MVTIRHPRSKCCVLLTTIAEIHSNRLVCDLVRTTWFCQVGRSPARSDLHALPDHSGPGCSSSPPAELHPPTRWPPPSPPNQRGGITAGRLELATPPSLEPSRRSSVLTRSPNPARAAAPVRPDAGTPADSPATPPGRHATAIRGGSNSRTRSPTAC